MDKLSKLQSLTGQSDPIEEQTIPVAFAYSWSKPQHLYEGTDSEEELATTRVVRSTAPHPGKLVSSGKPCDIHSFDRIDPTFEKYKFDQGQLAPENERFCPFNAVRKYPYMYVGNTNRQKVASLYFEEGKIFDQVWDFFYLYPDPQDTHPILLVPTEQFVHFLRLINKTMGTELNLPTGASNKSFQVVFENNGTPRPRYLGCSKDRDMADILRNNIPASSLKLKGESQTSSPSDRSLAAFQAKIALMNQAQKGKRIASKEKQMKERLAKKQEWRQSIKRVQRYMGIRELRGNQEAGIKERLANSGLGWGSYDAALQEAMANLPPTVSFHPEKLAQFDQESSVVFVCVDIEAYERNTKVITEIGIATLDTDDIKALVPGQNGENWMAKIRARHFRIKENKHLINVDFVAGCADRFEFGESEFISIKEAPQVVASCFKHPFSKPGANAVEDAPKRNVVLVGHDVGADVSFLRTIGYDVYNLSNLFETVDTAVMWRYLKREINPRNLGSILAELGIIGWHLHNAGNDAVYTLQAMIGIAIKHLDEGQKARDMKEKEKQERIKESIEEAAKEAVEREQGWSSAEESDGGPAIDPKTDQLKKNPRKAPKHNGGPWKTGSQTQFDTTGWGSPSHSKYRSSSGVGSKGSPAAQSPYHQAPFSGRVGSGDMKSGTWGSAAHVSPSAGSWRESSSIAKVSASSRWGTTNVEEVEMSMKDTKI